MTKEKIDYFDLFIRQAEICVQEADLLVEATENFVSAEQYSELVDRAHRIEHAGDELSHLVFNSVATEFITPLERGDIIELTQYLDDVVDDIEDIIINFYMYDIHFMHDGAKKFAHIIKKECDALYGVMTEFKNYKKSSTLHSGIVAVNDCEEEGDKLFFAEMRKLYTEERDNPLRVLVWSNIFNRMEKCCDACEHVADCIATAVLKNS